jgi:hypothetical protein
MSRSNTLAFIISLSNKMAIFPLLKLAFLLLPPPVPFLSLGLFSTTFLLYLPDFNHPVDPDTILAFKDYVIPYKAHWLADATTQNSILSSSTSPLPKQPCSNISSTSLL